MNYETNEYDDEIEVELAGAWERIGAALLNNIFTFLACIPMLVGLITAAFKSRDMLESYANLDDEELFALLEQWLTNNWFLLGLLILIIYGIAQCYCMSRNGQSFGKKLLNLKVIKQNGEDAGFVGVVLLREVVFNIGCAIILGILGTLLHLSDAIQNVFSYIPTIACVIMLFAATESRTLQDWIAGTVVIKLPRVRKMRRSR